MTPQKLHRTAAILETITWALLLLGMTLKYSGATDSVVPITGSIHGFGFLCFVVMTTLIWVNNRWTPILGLTGLVVSVIPFAAWPFARWAEKQGHLEGGWRFRNTETETHPEGIFDWVLYQTVRYPARSIVVVLVVVTTIFSLLLLLGPPVSVEDIINE